MSGASDKARFYLERYVPELQEYAEKEIFSRDEISNITAKRSDFEHVLNGRGSTPADYARYATYEMNLDRLRKRRCKRLRIRSTQYSGQRNVFFILERATKKFPGDIRLWMQYIEYCQQEKANKKLAKIFTQVLRLKPREYGLWVLAAKHYAESQGDMSLARSYFQRGIRFCKDVSSLWLEYAKLEMVYLAKLSARRKILGMDESPKIDHQEVDEDMIALPTITAADINPEANVGIEEVNVQALQRLASSPALSGAIPKAIFDASMKATKDDLNLAESFFTLISSFEQVPARRSINDHILKHLFQTAPESPQAKLCQSRDDISRIDLHSAEFAEVLSVVLMRLSLALEKSEPKSKGALAEKVVSMLLTLIKEHDRLGPDIVLVLVATFNRYLRIVGDTQSKERISADSRILIAEQHRIGALKLSDIIKTQDSI